MNLAKFFIRIVIQKLMSNLRHFNNEIAHLFFFQKEALKNKNIKWSLFYFIMFFYNIPITTVL